MLLVATSCRLFCGGGVLQAASRMVAMAGIHIFMNASFDRLNALVNLAANRVAIERQSA